MSRPVNDTAARAAVLPFRIIESLGIACGYERSFKLSDRRILANRYILGIDAGDVTRKQLMDACRQLNMPQNLQAEFMEGLADANTIFLGFEDGEQAGSTYKVYLEYWDKLKEKLRTGTGLHAPHLLHKGFKWHIGAPDHHIITYYQCLPEIEIDEIRQRIALVYRDLSDAKGFRAAKDIIDAAGQHRSEKQYLFVEIMEPGNSRKSFDLNLYPAGMRVKHIAEPIRNVAVALNVPSDKLEKLMPIIQNKFFGHISGGISRTGKEYFTVYYEN